MIRLIQAKTNVAKALAKKADEEAAYEAQFVKEHDFIIRTALQKHRNAISDNIRMMSEQAVSEGEHIIFKETAPRDAEAPSTAAARRIARLVAETIKAELEGDGYYTEVFYTQGCFCGVGLRYSWR